MGVNWAAGFMYWKPHVGRDGTVYGLAHVHPFRFTVHLPAHKGRPDRNATINVGFSMHAFTVKIADAGPDPEFYSDDRETRVFSLERYEWAFRLKSIVASLEKRKCYFTHRGNYATVDMDDLPPGQEYQLYFDLRKKAACTIELVVQSAYVERDETFEAGGQIVRFQTLVALGLAGKKPKCPS